MKSTQEALADPVALETLYQQHAPALLNYLVRLMGGSRPRAEDVLQETIIRAWHRPESRRPDGSWNVSWLFTVAKNIAIDHFRAIAARPAEVSDEYINERARVDDNVGGWLDGAEVRAAIRMLPPRMREVLVEVYLHDRSIADTAKKLGVPPGTVKSRLHYALKVLQRALARRGFHPQPESGLEPHDGRRRQQHGHR